MKAKALKSLWLLVRINVPTGLVQKQTKEMSQCTSIKTDMAFTENMFDESHPRHTFTNFIKMPMESKKKKKNFKQETKNKLLHLYHGG